MSADSRTRMLQSTAHLLGRRGLHGTSFRDVIEHSGAPRGSIYYHFPGGKAQLMTEAVRLIGQVGAEGPFDPDEDPVGTLWRVIGRWIDLLRETDFAAGCPIVAVIADGFDGDDGLTEAVSDFFAMTHLAIEHGLVRRGVDDARAGRAASLLTSAIEGAVMLCRAHRSMTTLTDVGAELEDYLRALLPTEPPAAQPAQAPPARPVVRGPNGDDGPGRSAYVGD
jgi:AcrR family transcriptional regulator